MGRTIGAANVKEYLGAIGITDRLRRTLIARIFDGDAHGAIAKAHGIKPQSSRKRQWRARCLARDAGLSVPMPARRAQSRRASLSLIHNV